MHSSSGSTLVSGTAALTFRLGCNNPPGKDKPDGDKAKEYLLFDRSGPVAGLTVQQYVNHAHGQPNFAPFYTFESEPPAHIKEILIRNGAGQSHEDGARLVVYTGQRRWLLNNGGEKIRVVDRQGAVQAEFTIPANTCATLPKAAAAVLIPSVPAAASFGPVR